MEISSKIIQILPLQTGVSKNGQWRKQDIIVETDDQYPKKICISIWGDKINEKQLVVGNILAISFDLESREYNGKWYTDVKATKINLIEEIPAKISTLDTKNAVDEEEVEEGIPF
jgi:hypothetical protein